MNTREIIFRVWHGGQMHTCESSNLIIRNGGYVIIEKNLGMPLSNDYEALEGGILMQYTGLKDENGKDIYEGDILSWMAPTKLYPARDFEEQNGYVHYDSQKSGFYVKYKEYPHYSLPNLQAKIIGNIYENLKLLKK